MECYGFDLSGEAKSKALRLAQERSVKLNYFVGSVDELSFSRSSYDAVGLIYAHFAAAKKSEFHRKLSEYVRPEGIIIFEAFSKSHLDYNRRNEKIGGPRELDMLFSKDELLKEFNNYEVLLLEETEVNLNDGKYHIGSGMVIRFVGRKLKTSIVV